MAVSLTASMMVQSAVLISGASVTRACHPYHPVQVKMRNWSLLQTSATQGRHLLGVSSGPWSGRQKNCWQHGIWLLQPSGWDWEREWVCGPDSWLMHVSTSELWGSGFTPLLASVLHSAPLWGTEGWHQSFQGQGVGSIHCSHRQIQPFPLQALQEKMS